MNDATDGIPWQGATSRKIRELAEDSLEKQETAAAAMENPQAEQAERWGNELPTRLELSGVHLTVAEVRKVYDKLPYHDQRTIKKLATRFVQLAKEDFPQTRYNFDNGLVDAAKLGLLLAKKFYPQVTTNGNNLEKLTLALGSPLEKEPL